jgi:2Fe-2S ferredoxin
MGTVHFVTPTGERLSIGVKPGNTVMEAAVANEVPGIEAQCYGAGICGTCHVYAQAPSSEKLPAPTPWEQEMLENLELGRAESRLACQIRFEDALDGAEFIIPERQIAMS